MITKVFIQIIFEKFSKKEVLQLLDSIIAHMDPIQDYVQLLAHTLPLVCAHTHLVGNVVATTTDVVQVFKFIL